MAEFKTGFVGASTAEATNWVQASVGEAKSIFVPFTGSGRDIVSMTSEGANTTSFDTLIYSKFLVDGVFAAKTFETNVDGLHFRKGVMYQTRALKNIDERCAGFADWVAEHGTDLDKAALTSSIIRSTLMGRMTQWYANIEQFWSRFQKARDYLSGWVNLPGTFNHTFGSVFDSLPTGPFDLMQVDPPKIVVGSDIYSAYFKSLNLLFDAPEPPKWNWREVLPKFEQLMQVEAERLIFLYVSDVRPPHEQVKALLEKYYDLEEEQMFEHRGRIDYGLKMRRK